jgi:hypothetical protein
MKTHNSIHEEISGLCNAAHNNLSKISTVPAIKPYGFMYLATILVNGSAYSDTFMFNPETYSSENMYDVLKNLLKKSGISAEDIDEAECTEGVLSYLLCSEDSYRHSGNSNNGISYSQDRRTVTITGNNIRYKTSGGKKNSFNWKTLDESVMIVINVVSEWKDPQTDEINNKALSEWLTNTEECVAKTQRYLNSVKELIAKAIADK